MGAHVMVQQLPAGFRIVRTPDDEQDDELPPGFRIVSQGRQTESATLPTRAGNAAQQPLAGINRGLDDFASSVQSLGRIVTDRPLDAVNYVAGREVFDTSAPPVRPISAAQNALFGSDYDDVPVNSTYDRYAQRIGEEGGATIPALFGVGLAGQATRLAERGRNAWNVFRPAVESFIRNPGRYAAAESASAIASGTGAQIAQDIAPGNQTAEMAGQIAAPTLLNLAEGTIRSGVRGLGRIAQGRAQAAVDDATTAGTNLTAGQLATTGPNDITAAGMTEAAARTMPGGNVVLPRVYAQQQDEMAENISRLARRLSDVGSPEGAGQAIRRGVDGIVGTFQRDADAYYTAVDDLIPQDMPVQLTAAQSTARDIAQSNPSGRLGEALGNPRVNRVVSAVLADEPLTYRDLSVARTRIGNMLSDRDLIGTEAEAPLRQLYGALSDDMATAAQQVGPEAETALRQAQEFYRQGRQTIDEFVQPLVRGARGTNPEASYRTFELAARRGPTAVREFRNRLLLTPDGQQAWDDIVGTGIRRLGLARPSQQGAEGAEFSVETFLTNWNGLRENGGLDELFQGTSYSGMRDDLDAIARTAGRMRGNFDNLRNSSGSGAAAITGLTVTAGLQQLMTGNLPGAAALLGTLGTSAGTATLMSRPWFVRWLAQATEGPIEQMPTYLSRLAATAQMAGSEEDQEAVDRYIEAVPR